jgi:hypothetical protein
LILPAYDVLATDSAQWNPLLAGRWQRSADEMDLSGNVQNTYTFFNGDRVARRDSAEAIHHYCEDHLNTRRAIDHT